MENSKKRTRSELSDQNTPSPLKNPTKALKMSEGNSFTEEQLSDQEMAEFTSDLENKTMEAKIDEILQLLKAQKVEVGLDINMLKAENRQLRLHLKEADGLIGRLTSKVTTLEEKLESMQIYSMKKNVIFYNIPEKPGENLYSEVERIMLMNLNIPKELIFSKENPSAPIRADVIHRIGQRKEKPRPVIVAFVTQQGRDIVLSRSKQLKESPYSMSEQLPPSVREKRAAQIPLMVKLRSEAAKTSSPTSVKLIKDKLFVNNEVTTEAFEANPVKITTPSDEAIHFNAITHSDRVNVKNSVFQGHFMPVHTEREVKKVIRALHQHETVADSNHIIYAYRFIDLDGQQVCGHSDDGEWTASVMLMDLLKEKGFEEAILVVTRKYGGINLGKKRFDLIKQVAKEAMSKT